ncbi:MAG: N-acetylmuramoyl-L-alanine amidase [Bacteroides sp.]|nr:N-acetylmuramoyl-L-alanine amidase [Bacteroides sp.]MCM1413224.1 N-acetylmuramoyl-L-alanine amidase [Bacteroides sp.]MCM1471466.1 N-acetylmuramoyl-L-alanine amidase [Bacteroides sp.]
METPKNQTPSASATLTVSTNPRRISKIIVHCTATPEHRYVTAADVDAWHRQRGFKMIGYHYLVRLDGTIEKGRDESAIGAHCTGHNTDSIGVCYVGGSDKNLRPKDTRTGQQRSALRKLVDDLQARYPGATVHGHYEFANKACPSFKIEDL